jgi:uncharacterized membrane protein YfcA
MLVTANVPSTPILVTLMMEALISSVTSVLTRATRRNIPEDTVLLNVLYALLFSPLRAICPAHLRDFIFLIILGEE